MSSVTLPQQMEEKKMSKKEWDKWQSLDRHIKSGRAERFLQKLEDMPTVSWEMEKHGIDFFDCPTKDLEDGDIMIPTLQEETE